MLNHHLQILCTGINGTGKSRHIATDKLKSYGVAHAELIPNTIHNTDQYVNNRAEPSPEATRLSERVMRRFKLVKQVKSFLTAHAGVSNHFNLGRPPVSVTYYRNLRKGAFKVEKRR